MIKLCLICLVMETCHQRSMYMIGPKMSILQNWLMEENSNGEIIIDSDAISIWHIPIMNNTKTPMATIVKHPDLPITGTRELIWLPNPSISSFIRWKLTILKTCNNRSTLVTRIAAQYGIEEEGWPFQRFHTSIVLIGF